jgi:hypothetical protein
MRDINFGTIRTAGLARLRERASAIRLLEGSTSAAFDSYRDSVVGAGHKATGSPTRGPHGGYPAEHYRGIARRYLELVRLGRRDVLKALCEEWSEVLGESVKRERMRGWLRTATQIGFLAPGQRGKAGRQPGPNLDDAKEETDG